MRGKGQEWDCSSKSSSKGQAEALRAAAELGETSPLSDGGHRQRQPWGAHGTPASQGEPAARQGLASPGSSGRLATAPAKAHSASPAPAHRLRPSWEDARELTGGNRVPERMRSLFRKKNTHGALHTPTHRETKTLIWLLTEVWDFRCLFSFLCLLCFLFFLVTGADGRVPWTWEGERLAVTAPPGRKGRLRGALWVSTRPGWSGFGEWRRKKERRRSGTSGLRGLIPAHFVAQKARLASGSQGWVPASSCRQLELR